MSGEFVPHNRPDIVRNVLAFLAGVAFALVVGFGGGLVVGYMVWGVDARDAQAARAEEEELPVVIEYRDERSIAPASVEQAPGADR